MLCFMSLLLFYAGVAYDLLKGDFGQDEDRSRNVLWRVKELARSVQTEGGRWKTSKFAAHGGISVR